MCQCRPNPRGTTLSEDAARAHKRVFGPYKFPDSDVSATSVQPEGSGLSVRLYEHHGKTGSVATVTDGLMRGPLRSLSGEEIEVLEPFQIGTLSLVPAGRE